MIDTEKLRMTLESDPKYAEALQLVYNNSEGDVWLVGGMLYKTIVRMEYGIDAPALDVDLVISKAKPSIDLPAVWTLEQNVFGDTTFIGPQFLIDFIELPKSYHIKYLRLDPTIQNYLQGASLSIQALAYNTKTGELIGEEGIKSLAEKTVSAHNPEVLKYYCNRKDIHPNEYITAKAKQLGFSAVLLP